MKTSVEFPPTSTFFFYRETSSDVHTLHNIPQLAREVNIAHQLTLSLKRREQRPSAQSLRTRTQLIIVLRRDMTYIRYTPMPQLELQSAHCVGVSHNEQLTAPNRHSQIHASP